MTFITVPYFPKLFVFIVILLNNKYRLWLIEKRVKSVSNDIKNVNLWSESLLNPLSWLLIYQLSIICCLLLKVVRQPNTDSSTRLIIYFIYKSLHSVISQRFWGIINEMWRILTSFVSQLVNHKRNRTSQVLVETVQMDSKCFKDSF